jgi:hypothetical protein
MLTYDMPDGMGGYKAVYQLNKHMGDPDNWESANDWTGHGSANLLQAARISCVAHGYNSVYKLRPNFTDTTGGDSGPEWGTLYMSQLASADGSQWTPEYRVNEKTLPWLAVEAYSALNYYGNEFDMMYIPTPGFTFATAESIKSGDPRTWPIPPSVGFNARNISEVYQGFETTPVRIYGSALGSDNVLWLLVHVAGARPFKDFVVLRDRTRARKGHTATDQQWAVMEVPFYSGLNPAIQPYLRDGFNICTLGATPMVVWASSSLGEVEAIASPDGGTTWLTA